MSCSTILFEQEELLEISRQVKNQKRFADFMLFCIERLNDDESDTVDNIWNAWRESQS